MQTSMYLTNKSFYFIQKTQKVKTHDSGIVLYNQCRGYQRQIEDKTDNRKVTTKTGDIGDKKSNVKDE